MMSIELLKKIVDQYTGPQLVTLQGEGEPLLHSKFWDIANYVKSAGHHVITTTNGSSLTLKNRQNVLKYVDQIGVSIDTTDIRLSESIGRHNIKKVITNIIALASSYRAITLRIVDFGQDYSGVIDLARSMDLMVDVQKLQTKADYKTSYPQNLKPQELTHTKFNCQILENDFMHFYNIDGVKLPCCFIKDVSKYPGLSQLKQFKDGTIIPDCCTGCSHIC